MAYDLKKLGERLKNIGIPVAEDVLEKVAPEVFDWFEGEAILSKTPYDNIIIPFLPLAKQIVLDQIDKIDPSDNFIVVDD